MRLPKPPAAIPFGRPESNRRNAQLSTGPRTTEGKRRSSQNAFRHGLYSKQLVTPDECAAELDELRATLRREHAPASTTEEILVDDLAQHFWRLRRFREMEARVWQPDSNLFTPATLALLARHLASAERSFFRTLAALTKLQQARGFVPQKQPAAAAATDQLDFTAEDDAHSATEFRPHQPPLGFVPPLHGQTTPSTTCSEAKTPPQSS